MLKHKGTKLDGAKFPVICTIACSMIAHAEAEAKAADARVEAAEAHARAAYMARCAAVQAKEANK